MLKSLIEMPAFGILITIVAYRIGLYVKEKTNSVLANPIVISVILISALLIGTGTPYETYKTGSAGIHYFLGPLTVALGLMLYRQRHIIKTHFFSLIIGVTSGVLASFFTIYGLSKAFGLDAFLTQSLFPKSITTPMALSLVEIIGGDPVLTIFMVIVTGIFGGLIAPLFPKVFKHLSSIGVGVGIGTGAHAVGTSKAIEMGETEGALSSAAIGLAGLITVLLVPLLYALFN